MSRFHLTLLFCVSCFLLGCMLHSAWTSHGSDRAAALLLATLDATVAYFCWSATRHSKKDD